MGILFGRPSTLEQVIERGCVQHTQPDNDRQPGPPRGGNGLLLRVGYDSALGVHARNRIGHKKCFRQQANSGARVGRDAVGRAALALVGWPALAASMAGHLR